MLGRAGAAVLVGLCCLVSGCSGGDPPPSNPTVTTSTSAVSTTTAAPSTTVPPTGAPVLPDAARQQTPAGAEAFVRHWYATLEYSWSVMDSTPLRALGDCLSCENFAGTIDTVAAEGNRLSGGDVTLSTVDPSADASGSDTTVLTAVSFAKQTIVAPDGSEELLGEASGEVQFIFELDWMSAWTVGEIRIVQ